MIQKSKIGPLILWNSAHIRGVQSMTEKTVYFYVYAYLERRMKALLGKQSLNPLEFLLIGYVSDWIQTLFFYPVDTVVTRCIKQGKEWKTGLYFTLLLWKSC